MSEKSKILFIGDIVGKPGRIVVNQFLKDNKQNYDLVIANVENASHGFGLTLKNHDELISYGVDIMTSGNHIWDKKDIYGFIDTSNALIRPANYFKGASGVGYRIFKDKYIVINLLGKTFMPPIDCPFVKLQEIINELKAENQFENKIIIVDFHAEATAEKQCFAKFASDLGVKAVIGTHTHVPTSDERIIDNKCAYQTDAGFSGSKNSIIGMEYTASLKRLMTSINERFDVETTSPYIMNSTEIIFDGLLPVEIQKKVFEYNIDEEKDSED